METRLIANSSYSHIDSALSRNSFRHEGRVEIGAFDLCILSKGVRAFVNAFVCRMHEEDPAEAVRVCESLLEEKDLDPAVRVGDVYGFLVEHYCHHGNFQQVCCVLRGFFTNLSK